MSERSLSPRKSSYICLFFPGIKKKLIRNDSSKSVDSSHVMERDETAEGHAEGQGQVITEGHGQLRFQDGQLVSGIFQTITSVDQVIIYFLSY